MRYACIEQHRDDYAVSRMCRLLLVSRTGYLQWRRRAPSARAQANARLNAHVAALHAASKGSYGRPRIVTSMVRRNCRNSLLRWRLCNCPITSPVATSSAANSVVVP